MSYKREGWVGMNLKLAIGPFRLSLLSKEISFRNTPFEPGLKYYEPSFTPQLYT